MVQRQRIEEWTDYDDEEWRDELSAQNDTVLRIGLSNDFKERIRDALIALNNQCFVKLNFSAPRVRRCM